MRCTFGRPLLLALLLAAAAVSPGIAGVRRERLPFDFYVDRATGTGSPTVIATTPDGTLHFLYHPGQGQSLRHAWRRGAHWNVEVVDPRYSFTGKQPIAVDAAGRIHVAYSLPGATYPDGYTVMHGVRDESGWTLTEIARGGSAVLYLGPDGRPRVVFEGPERMQVATFDGSVWVLGDFGPPPPDSIRPLQLLQGAGGNLHALDYSVDGMQTYATDSSGSWVREPEWVWSIALDSFGQPHLAESAPTGIDQAEDRLVHRWFDGAAWQDEDVLEWGVPLRLRWFAGLTADPEGHLFLAFYQQEQFPDVRTATNRVAYRDGIGWRDLPVGRAWSFGPFIPSLAADGSLHVTWYADAHARVALPDLAVDAEGLAVETEEGGVRVHGSFRVRNLGAGRAPSARVRFYLSNDEVLDELDEPVIGPRSVPSLRPGSGARIRVDRHVPGPFAGKRLLAVVLPRGRVPDLDRTNDAAALAIE